MNKKTRAVDKEGRLISVSDGSGAVMEYTYDQMNNRTSEAALLDELGHKKHFVYKYDKAGRLIQKEQKISRQIAITEYEYDDANNIVGITLPEREQTRFVYDEVNRVICRFEKDEKHSIWRTMVYEYSEFCEISKEELYGRKKTVRDINQLIINNKEIKVDSGKLFDAIYNENPKKIKYFSGKMAKRVYREFCNVYDDINQFVEKRFLSIDLGEEKKEYYQRVYDYDFRGNLLSKTDSLGNKWCYSYSLTGKLASILNPLGERECYCYDAKDRLHQHFDRAGGLVVELKYDLLNRLVEEKDAQNHSIRYVYDALSYEDRLEFDQQNIRDAYHMQRPNVSDDDID